MRARVRNTPRGTERCAARGMSGQRAGPNCKGQGCSELHGACSSRCELSVQQPKPQQACLVDAAEEEDGQALGHRRLGGAYLEEDACRGQGREGKREPSARRKLTGAPAGKKAAQGTRGGQWTLM